MGLLDAKVAVVTGAASGIGLAVAKAYGREGASVVVSDIDEAKGADAVREVEAVGGRAVFEPADVSDPEACRRLVERAVAEYGRLDVACNNAGIAGESNRVAEYSLEDWERVVKINLSGVFYCLRAELPAMLEGGGGAIVNMASILGQVSFPNAPAYVAAKHGVVGLTRNAAVDYATDGIRVNVVGPAFIDTPLLEALDEPTKRALVDLHPVGRLGKPEEVAELVLWLSSERASFVTGAYYPIDGGYLAR